MFQNDLLQKSMRLKLAELWRHLLLRSRKNILYKNYILTRNHGAFFGYQPCCHTLPHHEICFCHLLHQHLSSTVCSTVILPLLLLSNYEHYQTHKSINIIIVIITIIIVIITIIVIMTVVINILIIVTVACPTLSSLKITT